MVTGSSVSGKEIKDVRREQGQLGTRVALRAVAGPGVRTGAAIEMERQEGPHRTGGKALATRDTFPDRGHVILAGSVIVSSDTRQDRA